jgi:phosphate:Na+ symporter
MAFKLAGGIGLFLMGLVLLTDGLKAYAGDALRRALVRFTGTPAKAFLSGALATALVQSSSAAVATTLTALHAGAINFDQAAALIIGAAIGTTTTGALAAIGGNTAAKRTALAHVSFNLATGLIALALLPAFLRVLAWAQAHAGLDPGAMSLAAFHTLFIALGAAIFLPFARPYARAIEHLLPERGPVLTRHLDDTVLHAPAVALEATRRALRETAAVCFDALRALFANPAKPRAREEEHILEAIEQIETFFARIPPSAGAEPYSRLRVHLMHAIDHLIRLRKRLAPSPAIRHMINAPQLAAAEARLCSLLEESAAGLRGGASSDWLARAERQAAELAEFRRKERDAILESTAGAAAPPARALELLDAIRWLDRIGYHTWRICHYLGRDDASDSAPASDARASAHRSLSGSET